MKTSLDLDDINRAIKSAAYHQFPGTTLTVCCLTLVDGFNVVGQSACIDPAMFDEAMGRKIANDDAVNKVWQLEGYLLNYKIKRGLVVADETPVAPPAPLPGLHFDQVLAQSAAPVEPPPAAPVSEPAPHALSINGEPIQPISPAAEPAPQAPSEPAAPVAVAPSEPGAAPAIQPQNPPVLTDAVNLPLVAPAPTTPPIAG